MRTLIRIGIVGAVTALIPAFMSCGSEEGQPRPPLFIAKPASNTVDGGGVTPIDPCSIPGHAGCACEEPGTVIDCGMIDYVSGDYVTCVMGKAVCDGGIWGPCTGNRIVAQSLRGHALTPAGRRVLATTSQDCATPCDPRCTQVVGDTKDIDAGSLTISEAGVTLTQTVGAGPGSGPCKGLWCNVDACPSQPKTSVSGMVYDPAGKVPLYNAYVYIPVDPALPLPAFTEGVSCDTCAGATDVLAVAVAQTGADGKFTLNNVPYGDNLVPLVVQMGKWRRKVTLPSIKPCQDNPLTAAYTRLPRNSTDGDGGKADIPRMALASGDADPFECLLLKAGIDPAEIDLPSKNRRIDYYKYNGFDRAPGGAPAGSTLTGSVDTLKKYDVVLLPCEGAENAHNTQAPNIVNYTNQGGRMFTTHYGYVWLATPSSDQTPANLTAFYGTAKWKLGLKDYNDPTTAYVDQTFPKGAAFAQWMQNVAATTTFGRPVINEPRHNALSAISPSQRWVYASTNNSTAAYRDWLLSMTFNTPVGAAASAQCGRVVFSDFHVSADALVGNSTSCSADTDCGFGATCTPAAVGTCAPKTCTTASNCSTGYSCNGAAIGNCTTQACYGNSDCGTGRTCNGGATGTCGKSCTQKADCGNKWWQTCDGAAAGSCSAASCHLDGDCGVGTCTGETIGSCVPATTSCWANADCTSLNVSATCGGAVTGTCTSACKTNTDCGTASCSGAATGKCRLATPASCFTNATCTAVNASSSCSGATVGQCANATCKTNADCSSGTCNSATAGVCKRGGTTYAGSTCWADSDCKSYHTNANCNGPSPVLGKCSCTSNGQCGSGAGSCNGEVAGVCQVATSSCWANSECSAYGTGATCSGAVIGTCPAKTGCTNDAFCGGTRTCSGETAGTCTGPNKTCWATSDCGTLGAAYFCQGAVNGACSSVTCFGNADCGGTRTCSGGAVGLCAGAGGSCDTDSDCSGSSTCNGAVSGTCSAGTCYTNGNCGTSGTCTGGTGGVCQKACTASSQCGTLTCASGFCQGCTADNQCSSGTCVGDTPRACSASGNMFPLTCRNGDLTGQEKALEFMLFDLSACVSPDSWAPPVPTVSYAPVTFPLDFEASCDGDKLPVWREFNWKAEVPTGTNITFAAQTAKAIADYATAPSAALATTTSSTVAPNWDVAIIETSVAGAFTTAVPQISSLSKLRVNVTLNPSSDKKAAPTLIGWQVAYDCVDRL